MGHLAGSKDHANGIYERWQYATNDHLHGRTLARTSVACSLLLTTMYEPGREILWQCFEINTTVLTGSWGQGSQSLIRQVLAHQL